MSVPSDPALNVTLPVRAGAQRQSGRHRRAGQVVQICSPGLCYRGQWREVAKEHVCSGALRAFWQPFSLGHPVRPDVPNIPGRYLRLMYGGRPQATDILAWRNCVKAPQGICLYFPQLSQKPAEAGMAVADITLTFSLHLGFTEPAAWFPGLGGLLSCSCAHCTVCIKGQI